MWVTAGTRRSVEIDAHPCSHKNRGGGGRPLGFHIILLIILQKIPKVRSLLLKAKRDHLNEREQNPTGRRGDPFPFRFYELFRVDPLGVMSYDHYCLGCVYDLFGVTKHFGMIRFAMLS